MKVNANMQRCHAVFGHRGWRAGVVAMLFILTALHASASDTAAAQVSGVLTGYENPTPLASRDLHFQNTITGDVYLSPTHADGSFRVTLSPATYRLRTETGAVLLKSIVVGRANISLGRVHELAPLAPQRLWQSQSITQSRLTSPAPSTAYVKTADTTPLPAAATAVPKPDFNWTKPPPETPGPNAVTGMATAPLLPRNPWAGTPTRPGR